MVPLDFTAITDDKLKANEAYYEKLAADVAAAETKAANERLPPADVVAAALGPLPALPPEPPKKKRQIGRLAVRSAEGRYLSEAGVVAELEKEAQKKIDAENAKEEKKNAKASGKGAKAKGKAGKRKAPSKKSKAKSIIVPSAPKRKTARKAAVEEKEERKEEKEEAREEEEDEKDAEERVASSSSESENEPDWHGASSDDGLVSAEEAEDGDDIDLCGFCHKALDTRHGVFCVACSKWFHTGSLCSASRTPRFTRSSLAASSSRSSSSSSAPVPRELADYCSPPARSAADSRKDSSRDWSCSRCSAKG